LRIATPACRHCELAKQSKADENAAPQKNIANLCDFLRKNLHGSKICYTFVALNPKKMCRYSRQKNMVTRIAESGISMLANLSKIAASRCGKNRIGVSGSLPQTHPNATTSHPQHTTFTPDLHRSRSIKKRFCLLSSCGGGESVSKTDKELFNLPYGKRKARYIFRQV
jgi:hypothetical protein